MRRQRREGCKRATISNGKFSLFFLQDCSRFFVFLDRAIVNLVEPELRQSDEQLG
jgi:hypothetical protein